MPNWGILGILCTACSWALASPETPWQELEKEHSRRCPWDCMAFVQMWPGSFCMSLPRTFECILAKNADNWTIHGLWPDNVRECCWYWHLFPSDLVNLVSELNSHWPTFTNTSNFQFWEKEWQKHGTCAGCTEMLNSPQKYFGAALFLRSRYNIDHAFQSAAIVPSCKWSYQLSTLEAVLQPLLGDQHELQCIRDKQDRQILVQIKVFLFSSFAPGCISNSSKDVSPYKPCTAERKIFYFPPNPKNPHQPCPDPRSAER